MSSTTTPTTSTYSDNSTSYIGYSSKTSSSTSSNTSTNYIGYSSKTSSRTSCTTSSNTSSRTSSTTIYSKIKQYAKQWDIDGSDVEWTIEDFAKWRTNGGAEFLFERKTAYVEKYKDVIKDAAVKFDIPKFLLAGVAFTEYGGDPVWTDDVMYELATYDRSGPDWVDQFAITKDPLKVSFGNVRMQVRRGLETVEIDASSATSQQISDMINSLKDPVENIYLVAKHLLDLRNIDYNGTSAGRLSVEQQKVIATRYNRGPDLSLSEIKENMSYGNSIFKHYSDIMLGLESNGNGGFYYDEMMDINAGMA